jgi:hypothetical protein
VEAGGAELGPRAKPKSQTICSAGQSPRRTSGGKAELEGLVTFKPSRVEARSDVKTLREKAAEMKPHQPLISPEDLHRETEKQVGRRDLLRYGLSFTAVSALSNTSVSELARLGPSMAQQQPASKPNIVFLLMDNLGYGEVGCYGGGITRGAPTPRIDKLATEGTRLTNFNVEAQCSPSRDFRCL